MRTVQIVIHSNVYNDTFNISGLQAALGLLVLGPRGLGLGGTTCLTLLSRCLSNTASFVSCVFRRAKDRHNSLQHSPLMKQVCVRQVVLDKWLPLIRCHGRAPCQGASDAPRRLRCSAAQEPGRHWTNMSEVVRAGERPHSELAEQMVVGTQRILSGATWP